MAESGLGFSYSDEEAKVTGTSTKRGTERLIGTTTQTTDQQQTQQSTSQQDIEKQIQQESTTLGKQTGATNLSVQDVQQTTSLDQQTQQLLQNLIANVSGGVVTNQAQINDIAQQLQTRAQTAPGDITAQTDALISEAQRSGQKELGQLVTQLAQATGSKQNTFVQQAAAEGQIELDSRLAALGADFALRARDAQTQELANVVSTLGSGATTGATQAQQVAQLASVLKGATTTATGTSTQAGTSESETSQQVEALTSEAQQSKQVTDLISQMFQTSETETDQLKKIFEDISTQQKTAKEGFSFGLNLGKVFGA